ncbi:hypothetical protein A2U01_0094123, partial [Trifolium medium]|nr:hypothetical protein [Trifolium medium]
MGNNGIVSDKSARNKGTLVWANDSRKNSFKSVSNGFSNNLESHIAERYWSKVTG